MLGNNTLDWDGIWQIVVLGYIAIRLKQYVSWLAGLTGYILFPGSNRVETVCVLSRSSSRRWTYLQVVVVLLTRLLVIRLLHEIWCAPTSYLTVLYCTYLQYIPYCHCPDLNCLWLCACRVSFLAHFSQENPMGYLSYFLNNSYCKASSTRQVFIHIFSSWLSSRPRMPTAPLSPRKATNATAARRVSIQTASFGTPCCREDVNPC